MYRKPAAHEYQFQSIPIFNPHTPNMTNGQFCAYYAVLDVKSDLILLMQKPMYSFN
jgi:hypothetical protein